MIKKIKVQSVYCTIISYYILGFIALCPIMVANPVFDFEQRSNVPFPFTFMISDLHT